MNKKNIPVYQLRLSEIAQMSVTTSIILKKDI